MHTLVRRDQFDITPQGIVHRPTDASFTPCSADPLLGTVRLGRLRNPPGESERFNADDVERIMRELWTDYVINNPELVKR